MRAVVDLRPYASVDAVGDASLVARLRPGRAGDRRPPGDRPRARRRRRVPDAGAGHGAQPDRPGARPRHRLRHPGPARGAARAAGGGDRHLAAGAVVRAVQRRAEHAGRGGAWSCGTGPCWSRSRGSSSTSSSRNPPFVITPHAGAAGRAVADALGDYEYRDGGRAGDDLVRDLVLGVGGVLAPGGTRSSWATGSTAGASRGPSGSAPGSTMRAWTAGSSSARSSTPPSTPRPGSVTAAPPPTASPDAWAAAYGAWLDDFASRDVEAVGFGIVTLRRPVSGAARRCGGSRSTRGRSGSRSGRTSPAASPGTTGSRPATTRRSPRRTW